MFNSADPSEPVEKPTNGAGPRPRPASHRGKPERAPVVRMAAALVMLAGTVPWTVLGQSSGTEVPGDDDYERAARQRLMAIELSDGVDQREATVIFEIYGYLVFICNNWGAVEDGGSVWHGTVLSHWGDQAMAEKVSIDKVTGAVSWTFGPHVSDPRKLLDMDPSQLLAKPPL